jgi:hypothetical protein
VIVRHIVAASAVNLVDCAGSEDSARVVAFA